MKSAVLMLFSYARSVSAHPLSSSARTVASATRYRHLLARSKRHPQAFPDRQRCVGTDSIGERYSRAECFTRHHESVHEAERMSACGIERVPGQQEFNRNVSRERARRSEKAPARRDEGALHLGQAERRLR